MGLRLCSKRISCLMKDFIPCCHLDIRQMNKKLEEYIIIYVSNRYNNVEYMAMVIQNSYRGIT